MSQPPFPPPSPDRPRPQRVAPRLAAEARPPVDAWKAWATYALIAANVAMFAFELAAGAGLAGPDPRLMIALGGNFGPLTSNGQAWRLVTGMFLHYGVVHIGMNMVCLYQIRIVERMVSRAEFVALYFASGLIGGLASVAIHPHTVSVGASGAVFGMFGAFAALLIARRKYIEPGAWRSTMRSLGIFFALNLVFGMSQSGIDLSAHVGGLATGFAFGFALAKPARHWSMALVRAAIVAAIGAGVAFGGIHALPR